MYGFCEASQLVTGDIILRRASKAEFSFLLARTSQWTAYLSEISDAMTLSLRHSNKLWTMKHKPRYVKGDLSKFVMP